MKQFYLNDCLKNPDRKVVTRDGRAARVICTDVKCQYGYRVVALVTLRDGSELPQIYTECGEFIRGDVNDIDLFFAPVKQELWVAAYYVGESPHRCIGTFESEEEFLNYKKIHPEFDFVMEQKIEWEE